MADTGIMRWPINFPPSSKTAILSEASVGRTTCHRDEVTWLLPVRQCHTRFPRFLPALTFLKTIGSSSQTGLMALLFWEVLVFSAFLLVSAGSPNISTSTYTPTLRSVRNWPEITWNHDNFVSIKVWFSPKMILFWKGFDHRKLLYLHREGVGYNAIHCVFCEGVKVFVRPPHELGFQPVATPTVVLEHKEVELHRQVCNRKPTLQLRPHEGIRITTWGPTSQSAWLYMMYVKMCPRQDSHL